MYRVVSMFSGCGGMDLGFIGGFRFAGSRYPRHPFEIAWANDISVPACNTYRLNLGHEIIDGDVALCMAELPKQADVVIGGFPCQDVSINGLRQVENGNRTVLYRFMIEAVVASRGIRRRERQGLAAVPWTQVLRHDDGGLPCDRV